MNSPGTEDKEMAMYDPYPHGGHIQAEKPTTHTHTHSVTQCEKCSKRTCMSDIQKNALN